MAQPQTRGSVVDSPALPVQRCQRWSFVNARSGTSAKDAEWWGTQWQRLSVQGVVIPNNYAGGAAAVAALIAMARKAGLAVMIGVDSGTLDAATAAMHPDWVARRADGVPIETSGGVAPCVNTGYFQTEVPSL